MRAILNGCCFRLYKVLVLALAIHLPVWASAEVPGALDAANGELDAEKQILWYDALQLRLEGQAWQDIAAPYDRLPENAEVVVPSEVWRLSHYASGLLVAFVTDSPSLLVRWSVQKDELHSRYSSLGATSGVDLYAWDGKGWRYAANGLPKARENEVNLLSSPPSGARHYLLYLPLLNGVDSVRIGIDPGASIAPAPQRTSPAKPVVFYGTSITQGVGASRPAMCYPAILGRRLNVEVINLGFAGAARMELPIAELLAEIDAAVYVLDPVPNMSVEQIAERYVPFVERLRELRPDTPIVLVGRIIPPKMWLSTTTTAEVHAKREAMEAAWRKLQTARVRNLHFVPGHQLLGEDGEDTSDGLHPSDLGFTRIADTLQPVLKPLVKKARRLER